MGKVQTSSGFCGSPRRRALSFWPAGDGTVASRSRGSVKIPRSGTEVCGRTRAGSSEPALFCQETWPFISRTLSWSAGPAARWSAA